VEIVPVGEVIGEDGRVQNNGTRRRLKRMSEKKVVVEKAQEGAENSAAKDKDASSLPGEF